MSGAIIAVIVAVVVVIAIVAAMTMMRGGGASGVGLKRRFGPEYERTLAQHDGDDKATRQELSERVKRYGGMERQPVSAQQREAYGERWAEIQTRFVDDPGTALTEADRLIAEVAAQRGYPAADSPEHFDALSVHHPHQLQGYRQARALTERAGTDGGATGGASGSKGTEDMRQALVSARALFDDMLRDAGTTSRKQVDGPAAETPVGTTATDPAGAVPAPASEPVTADGRGDADPADPDAADDGQEHHRPLADRFAGLTGGTRRGRDAGTDDHS
ncbi:hypothetical protein ACFO3J_34845 [Streptomyces polygonati]|uniref:Secreted protein n=1 Tax=Streptomyces polygonati TaxID=1617087 RepID=A0ABV8I0F2_9ACTN